VTSSSANLKAHETLFMDKQSRRLRRDRTGLVVVDIQERLLPSMWEHERALQNSLRLIRGAAILGVPVLATEQYRKGLGATVPQIAAAVPGFTPLEKLTFSSCGAEGFTEALQAKNIRDVLLCGIETHVCVAQTCLDLLDSDFRVFVVADAVSSRAEQNHYIGLDRMRASGAIIVSTEMVLFELLGRAGSEEFKQILTLVK
jgi:nicotinamidase-related amidase